MLKHFVFDMGNVLVRYAPEEFLKEYTENTDEQELLLNVIFKSQNWLDFDRGILSKEELIDQTKNELPQSMHPLVKNILNFWYQGLEVIPEMEKVIKFINDKGYSIYLLSNTSKDFYTFKDKIPSLKYFDGLFISPDWEYLKPEPEIYHKFFEKFQLEPENCFFVDDLAENIQEAENQGMKGYVFDGNVEKLFEYISTLL